MRGYPQKYVIYTQPVIEPLGESRSDTDIIYGLAQKLGLDYQMLAGESGGPAGAQPPADLGGFLPNGAPDFGAAFDATRRSCSPAA
jgi:anaerobic selenocysteine-containing dehydrogenase